MTRPPNYCGACKTAPCRIPPETITPGTVRSYVHGCRCQECRDAYSRSRGRNPSARGRKADGYIDDMAVERFVSGDIDWRQLTVPERLAAAERMDRAGVPRREIHAATHVKRQVLAAHLIAVNGRVDSWRRPQSAPAQVSAEQVDQGALSDTETHDQEAAA